MSPLAPLTSPGRSDERMVAPVTGKGLQDVASAARCHHRRRLFLF
jgi:hypothetical protein